MTIKLPVLTMKVVTPAGLDWDISTKGFKLLEDVKNDIPRYTPELNLELVEFRGKGEPQIKEHVIKRRAKRLDAYHGQKLARYLIREQNQILKEWHPYRIFFPGTVYGNALGPHIIPYMYWDFYQWNLDSHWFCNDSSHYDRLIRIYEPANIPANI